LLHQFVIAIDLKYTYRASILHVVKYAVSMAIKIFLPHSRMGCQMVKNKGMRANSRPMRAFCEHMRENNG